MPENDKLTEEEGEALRSAFRDDFEARLARLLDPPTEKPEPDFNPGDRVQYSPFIGGPFDDTVYRIRAVAEVDGEGVAWLFGMPGCRSFLALRKAEPDCRECRHHCSCHGYCLEATSFATDREGRVAPMLAAILRQIPVACGPTGKLFKPRKTDENKEVDDG